MPQYEYKVIKSPHNLQEFHCSCLASFGWQVQSIQESVDRVVNQSVGFSRNTNFGSMDASTFYHRHSNHAMTNAYFRSSGWGMNMGTNVTDVQTSLTITLFRDTALPYRNELNAAENRFWSAMKLYVDRFNRTGNWGDGRCPERKALDAACADGTALLQRKAIQAQETQAVSSQAAAGQAAGAQAPAQVPNTPATATIQEMEVVHNVFQGDQPGIQIHLRFNIQNRKGFRCWVMAYFYDAGNNFLRDVNQRFRSGSGTVMVGANFIPDYDDALFDNYLLFMPYEELDLPDGDRNLSLQVHFFDEAQEKFFAASAMQPFRFIRNGKTMRGEVIRPAEQPVAAQPAAASPRPKAGKKADGKAIRPAVEPAATESAAQPAAASPRPKTGKKAGGEASQPRPASSGSPEPFSEAWIEEYRKQRGWEELTEDRKACLDGLRACRVGADRARAMTCYQQAIAINPKEPLYYHLLHNEHLMKLAPGQALKVVKQGLGQAPDDPGLLLDLASLHLRKGEPEKAGAALDRCETLPDGKKAAGLYFLRAQLAETRQDYTAAIQYYDQADALQTYEPLKQFAGTNQKRLRALMKARK